MDPQPLLEEIARAIHPRIGEGKVADYIPALASVDPRKFGMALATVDGDVHGIGDFQEPFSIQSISKLFTLSLVLAHDGDAIFSRVGREPSGNPFNSLVQLEHEHGIPRNPFINAGALVVTDRLLQLKQDAVASVLEFVRAESGNPAVAVDETVAASERAFGQRNAALGYYLASWGNLRSPVDLVLDHYFRHCSIAMSCAELALAGRYLARHGVRADGSRLLTRSEAKRINSILLTCGAYDAAGEFAYRVGLPGKSGVGGGILAIVPGRCAICVWSPGLDPRGNSVAGVAALDEFTTRTGWSVF